MKQLKSAIRPLAALCLLIATALFLDARNRNEFVPTPESLANFPVEVDHWQAQDVPIPANFLESLGPGDFLSRFYSRPGQPPIDFFIAYFPSQRRGDTIHSPKNCLPGAGWMFTETGRIQIPGTKISAGKYLISKEGARQVVIYWYQAHGRAVASEYSAKFFLVADSIRLNRTDGALVRVITPVAPNEEVPVAESRAVSFAAHVAPDLNRFIPE